MKLDASFYSQALDEIKKVDIYLPSDYYDYDTLTYPVIYFLHGANGNQNDYSDVANALYFMISDSLINPFILVKPDGSCAPYLGSYYTNSALYGNYEDFIMQDVIGFIESNFKAIPAKYARYISGHSMGGGGSFILSIKYPEVFRAVLASSNDPCGELILEPWRQWLYEENDSSWHFNYNAGSMTKLYYTSCGAWSPNLELDPPFNPLIDTSGNFVDTVLARLRLHDPGHNVRELTVEDRLAFYITCGTNDEFEFYPSNLAFVDTLEKYNIDYQFRPYIGTHAHNIPAFMDGFSFLDSIFKQELLLFEYENPAVKIDVLIYPNPAQETINISLNSSEPETAVITIYNQLGQRMGNEIPFNTTIGNKELSFDISSFKNGVYFLQINVDGKMLTNKFIKQ